MSDLLQPKSHRLKIEFRRARMRAGLTITEASRAVGVAPSTITAYEELSDSPVPLRRYLMAARAFSSPEMIQVLLPGWAVRSSDDALVQELTRLRQVVERLKAALSSV